MATRPSIREKTKDEYRTEFRDYGDWCERSGHDPFIQPSAVGYIEQVLLTRKPPYSITTINKHIRRLSSLFIWCADRGYSAKNIFAKLNLPKPKMRVSDQRPALTHAELETLLVNLKPIADPRHWVSCWASTREPGRTSWPRCT
jgi:site-specific recombinase XerD